MSVETMEGGLETDYSKEGLDWGEYPAGVNLGQEYKTKIEEIDGEKDETKKDNLRKLVVGEIFEKYFKPLEKNQSVFFNAMVPKKKCIPKMLRRLFERIGETLKVAGEPIGDLENATGEAIADFIEHEKKDSFPLKIFVGLGQISVLIGDSNLTENMAKEEMIMPDPLEDRGRGIPMMLALSDSLSIHRNEAKDDYAFLIEKNYNKTKSKTYFFLLPWKARWTSCNCWLVT